VVFDNGMTTRDLERAVDAFPELLEGVTAQDEVALFRYDHSVWRLADFSNEPREIAQRFGAVHDIAESRPPDESIDPIEDTRPRWLRFLGGIFKSPSNGPTRKGTGIPPLDQRRSV